MSQPERLRELVLTVNEGLTAYIAVHNTIFDEQPRSKVCLRTSQEAAYLCPSCLRTARRWCRYGIVLVTNCRISSCPITCSSPKRKGISSMSCPAMSRLFKRQSTRRLFVSGERTKERGEDAIIQCLRLH